MPTATRKKTAHKPTLRSLSREVAMLRERVEDLEDLSELEQAIAGNAGKPLVPWEKAKKDLGLDWKTPFP